MPLPPYLDPFLRVFETSHYPKARSLRTTFWQKVVDTFYVFLGVIPGKSSKQHWGFVDYLLLGIWQLGCYIAGKVISVFNDENASLPKKIGAWVLAIPLFPIVFILTLSKLLLSAAFTLICLPFIAVAHLIFKSEGDALKEKIRHKVFIRTTLIKTKDREYYFDSDKNTTQIEDMLAVEIEDINSKVGYAKLYNVPVNSQSGLKKQGEIDKEGMAYLHCFYSPETSSPNFQIELNTKKPDDKEILDAFLKLNLFHVTEKIEEERPDSPVFQNVGSLQAK